MIPEMESEHARDCETMRVFFCVISCIYKKKAVILQRKICDSSI
jgi:hypothetical protein